MDKTVSNGDREDEISRLKKMNHADVLDEDYSVDGFIENLKRKNVKSFEKISDSVDSPRKDCHNSLNVSTSTKDLSKELSYLELRDLVDRRVSDARFDVVENKIDRVITSLKSESNGDEKKFMKLMIARIRDLEHKLDQKAATKKYVDLTLDPATKEYVDITLDPRDKYLHPYSTYVVEKATQTPSKDHTAEGVYVLVSKKNNQKVRQVHRNIGYLLDDEYGFYNYPRGAYHHPYHNPYYNHYYNPYYYLPNNVPKNVPTKPAQTKESKDKKVVRRYGYPEYVCEETRGKLHPSVRRTLEFLPPIPAPYAKRRPRPWHTW